MVSAKKSIEIPKRRQDGKGRSSAPPVNSSKKGTEFPKRRQDGKGRSSAAPVNSTKKDAEIPKRRQNAKGKSSASPEEPEEPKIDIRSILKDIQFLGTEHMTWKEKKDLENRKVVSLGGKPPKKQRLPLSVARVAMKKQKEREEKQLQERALLGRFGGYYTSSTARKPEQRHRPEDRILRSTVGNFRNGILDVQHMLNTSSAQPTIDRGAGSFNGEKKSKGGKKGHGKKKGGGKRRR